MADQDDTVKVRVDSGDAESGLNRIERATKGVSDGLLAMGVAGQNAFDRLTGAISDGSAFAKLQSAGQNAFTTIQQSAQLAFESIRTNLTSLGGSAFNTLRSVGVQAFNDIRQAAQTSVGQISSAIAGISSGSSFGALGNSLGAVFDSIKSKATDTANFVKSALATAQSTGSSIATSFIGSGSAVNSTFQALRTTTSSVFDSIKASANQAGATLGSSFGAANNTVRSVFDSIKGQAGQLGSTITSSLGGASNTIKTIFSSFGNTSQVSAATSVFNGLKTSLSGLVPTIGGVASGFSTAFSGLSSGASAAGAIMTGALTQVTSGIFSAGNELQALQTIAETVYSVIRNVFIGLEAVGEKLLTSLTKLQGFFAGLQASYRDSGDAAAKAAGDYQFLKDTSNTLGISLEDILQNYTRLSVSIPDSANKAASLRNVFTGLAQAAQTLHLSQGQVNSAFLAIDELASRGTASLQQFRRQLGIIPGVIEETAKLLGTSVQELEDKIKGGAVDSVKLVEVIGPALSNVFARSSTANADSIQSSFNRIKNLFQDFAKTVLDSGGAEVIGQIFDTIREKLQDSAIIEQASALVKDLATQILNFVKSVSAEDIERGFKVFADAVKAVAGAVLYLLEAIEKLVKFGEDHSGTLHFLVDYDLGLGYQSAKQAKAQGLPGNDSFGTGAPTLAFAQQNGSIVTPTGTVGGPTNPFTNTAVDFGSGKAFDQTAGEKIGAAITTKIQDALGKNVDLTKFKNLTDGIRTNTDALNQIGVILSNPKLRTDAQRLQALQTFNDQGLSPLPGGAPSSLNDVLNGKGKAKKEKLDSGEQYLVTLQNQLGVTEQLSAVETLRSKIAEGLVKFKNDEQFQGALNLATEIDQLKTNDFLEKLYEAEGKKKKDLTESEKLEEQLNANKLRFLSAADVLYAKELAADADKYQAQEKLLAQLDKEYKARSSIDNITDKSVRNISTKTVDAQSQIDNLGGDPFKTSQAKLFNDELKAIQNTEEEIRNDAIHNGLAAVADQLTDAYGKRAIAALDALLAKTKELHDKSLEAATGINQFYTQISLELQDKAKVANTVLNDLLTETTNAFNTLITTGKFSFSDFARSVIQDLEKVIAKMLILQAFKGIGDLLKGTGVGDVFGKVIDILGGGATKTATDAVGSAGATAADTALTTLATTTTGVDTTFGTLATSATGVDTIMGTLTASATGVDTGFGTLIGTGTLLDTSFGVTTTAAGTLATALYAAAAAAGGSAGAGAAGDVSDVFDGVEFSAMGNVFSSGNLVPFARGGVFNSPHVFPMANGGIGLLGEAGPEAVVPLDRTSSGKLGVNVTGLTGGQGGTGGDQISVVVNVNQSDGSSDVQSNKDSGAQLGRLMVAAIQTWVAEEKRPGGQLEKAA